MSMRTAAEFITVVQGTLAQGHICILYETATYPAFADPDKIWPEMRCETFRAEVLLTVPHGRFSPPDDLDEWTFTAYPVSHRFPTSPFI